MNKHNSVATRLFFPPTRTPALVRYGFALACCTACFLFRLLLEPLLREHSPLLLFCVAVATAALRGGVGPGIFSAIVSIVASFYFVPPVGSLAIVPEYRVTVAYQLAAFVAVSIVLSLLGGSARSARFHALALAEREAELSSARNEILESIPDGFLSLDRAWRVIYLSVAASGLAKHRREDAVGNAVWDEFPSWVQTTVEQQFRAVMEHGDAVHFEYRMPQSDRWLEFHVHPKPEGGLAISFRDITDRKRAEIQLREALAERDAALSNVRLLSGLLPICAGCKKIRDERGSWQQMERYISNHSEAKFSHSLCPECAKVYSEDLA